MEKLKGFRATLDYCMANETALNQAILEKKQDSMRHTGGGHRSGISKPTEAQALWNLASVGTVLVNDLWSVDEPERMLNAIRYTKAHFNGEVKYGQIYKAKYIDREAWNVTCSRLLIPRSTYYDRVNAILDYGEQTWKRLKC